jgi:hypothetical protein
MLVSGNTYLVLEQFINGEWKYISGDRDEFPHYMLEMPNERYRILTYEETIYTDLVSTQETFYDENPGPF